MNNIEVFMVMAARLEIERLERQGRGPMAAEYKILRPSEVRRRLLPRDEPAPRPWWRFASRPRRFSG